MGRHAFDLLMELQSHEIRLDCAALHFARDEYLELNIGSYLRELDALADDVVARQPGLLASQRFQVMRDVLVGIHGLRGDLEDYYNPQNSYLNRVLDRRRGMPISLSVIWLEVARRMKWPVSGVALPGHFLVRFDDPNGYLLVDPFSDGQMLSVEDCRRLVEDHYDGASHFDERMLEPVDTRAILTRMLKNLRYIYLAQGDWPRLAAVLRRLVAVEPANGQHLQDLASVCARRGDMRGAYQCLRAYLRRVPDAHDCDMVQCNLARLEAALTALN